MTTHTIKTNLKGLKRWAWRKNLKGFFSVNGKELSDAQVREMVEWASQKATNTMPIFLKRKLLNC